MKKWIFSSSLSVVLICFTGCANQLGLTPNEMLHGAKAIEVTIVDGECDTLPMFVEGRVPVFPGSMIGKYDSHTPAHATVSFLVNVDGTVTSPKVVDASHPQFAAGIGHVLPTWKFIPATYHGSPVAVRCVTSWNFKIIY